MRHERSPPGDGCRRQPPSSSARGRSTAASARRPSSARRTTFSSPRAELRAAAAELDRGLARGLPVVDATVDDRAGVEAARAEDARGNGGTRPRLADSHERPVVRKLRGTEREQAIRDVAAAGDVARVALVSLTDVDELC